MSYICKESQKKSPAMESGPKIHYTRPSILCDKLFAVLILNKRQLEKKSKAKVIETIAIF